MVLGSFVVQGVKSFVVEWWLTLTSCPKTTDAGLVSLAAGCAAITDLDLTDCDQITDAGLASLVAGCTAITTTLHLYYCDQITDSGLASLTTECPSIEIRK